MISINHELTNSTIIAFWRNYLGFAELSEQGESLVIPHNLASTITENQCVVFEHVDAGKIISVSAQYVASFSAYIGANGYSFEGVKNEFELLTQKQSQLFGPVHSLYLFSTEKLLSKSSDVTKIGPNERKIFDDFMDSCVDGERALVDMDIEDSTHRFFILQKDGNVVSLANYSIDESTGIAHIGIITPQRYSGNGYGTELVNAVVHDILDNNLIPQYRAKETNVASLAIAQSLGFTLIVKSFTLEAIL